MVLGKCKISPPFISKNQITVTILEVVNPAHYVIKEAPSLNASSEAKNFLEAEESMQKYYASFDPCFTQLPLKGAIIVVLYEKKYYRAKVVKILNKSAGHLFKVYLVDYGVECSVTRDCIYEIEKDFMDHPFQAVDMKLLGIEPVSLVMNSADLSMSYGPVTYWDPSAVILLNEMEKKMCNAYIEIKAIDERYIYGNLFMCFEDNTVKCINDELISNTYAHFNESCWETVHKIEDVLDNNFSTPVKDKFSTPERLKYASDSSDSPSKIEQDFNELTTTFLRSSDGKVVAKSSFGISESSLKDQEDNLEPGVLEKSEAVSPVVLVEKSSEHKAVALKRLQRLQMLNKKRHSSPGNQNNESDSSCPSTEAENTVLPRSPSSDVSLDQTESSIPLNIVEKGKSPKSSIASSNDTSINSNNFKDQPVTSKTPCSVSENEMKQGGVSQAETPASNRLKKLQELHRKRQKFVSNDDHSADVNNATHVVRNLSIIPTDKEENTSNCSNANILIDTFSDTVKNTSSVTVMKNTSKQECLSEVQENSKDISPVISKEIPTETKLETPASSKLKKLQELHRKRQASNVHSTDAKNTSNTGSKLCDIPSEQRENISKDSIINKDSLMDFSTTDANILKSSDDDKFKSCCVPPSVPKDIGCAAEKKNSPKQESTLKEETLATSKLKKLQELHRKRRTNFVSSNDHSTDAKDLSNLENDLSNAPPDEIENSLVDSNVITTASFSDSDKNISNISSDSDHLKSCIQSPVSEDTSYVSSMKNSPNQECISEAQLIARKKFQKLQLLNKKKLPSPICQSHSSQNIDSQSTCKEKTDNVTSILSGVCSDKIENAPNKSNAKESEMAKNDCTTQSKPFILEDSDNVNSNYLISKTHAPDEMVYASSEISPKQENKQMVIPENARTLQKLQQKLRRKKVNLQSNPSSDKSSHDLKNVEASFKDKCSDDLSANNSNLISGSSEQMTSSPPVSLSENHPDKKLSTMSGNQEINEIEKEETLVEKTKEISQTSIVTNESNLLHGASHISQLITNDTNLSCEDEILSESNKISYSSSSFVQHLQSTEKISSTKSEDMETTSVVTTLASPISATEASPQKTVRKNRKSLSDDSKSNFESDVDTSPMQPKQSEILNELLAMSDSDDILCSISQKKEESSSDNIDIEENYIELSTQLKHSDPKLLKFNELSLWQKQKVPALLIGIGLIRPVLNVEEAKFSKHVTQVLKEIKFYGPSCIQSVIWPCMEKNRCMIAVAPPHSGKTVSYVLPLVSSFSEGKVSKQHSNGPSTIILCSSWLKAQAVYDFFHFFLCDKKMNIITLCTDGGHYRNKVISLINSCDVLIATPYCLLQFLKDNSIKFAQLENFILDDSTTLLNKHKKELKNILLNYMGAIKRERVNSQLMLFAERWNKNFHIILDKMMSNPLIFFTSFLESALYAKVSIFAHVCKSKEKESALIDVVAKEVGKIVICTTNMPDAVDVHHFLRCEDVRSFLVNEEMEHYIADEVIRDWKSIKCITNPYCLVITDQALIKRLCVSDADCLVHYDIPQESRLQFGNRFSCIAEHFQAKNPYCVSHILVTECDYNYAAQIAEIIENSGGKPSEELIELSKKQDQVEGISGLLCPYLKAFGFCNEHLCKNRHIIDSEKDKPQVVPFEGDIEGFVTQIVDASHYYVRLLKYLDPVSNKTVSLISAYAELGFLLRDFYCSAPEEMKVEIPVVGENYVLAEENNLFYRIKVLKEVNQNPPTTLSSWKVLFLDEGWIKCYEKPELYKLTDQITLPEPLAVEVYVCNIVTPDSCFDWNSQTSQLVSDLIKGKEIHGKIALCLGKTLWLDPIALVLHLPNTNEYVNLFKLHERLLDCGHAKPNKYHLENLRKACRDKIPFPRVAKPRIKKEEKVAMPTPTISYAFLECNKYEDVYVSGVKSPHQLYVQRAKFVECVDNLLDKINAQIENRKLKQAFTLYKGMHCIAPFYEDNRYYRAVITDVSDVEVQLFYVDFGDNGNAPRNNIYCLPAEFLLLPFQAIECELAGIAPAHGGWTDSSVDALTTLTRDEAGDMKILQLKAYSKTSCYEGGNHYVIDLWFNEKSLSEQLLQAGLGIPAEVPEVTEDEPCIRKLQDSSSENSSDEEFNLNERTLPSDTETDPEDKEITARFYGYIATKTYEAFNLVPKPGVEITEVSSDNESCVTNTKSNGTNEFKATKACKDLVKLLPKIDLGDKNGSSLEPCSKSLRPLITWWDTPEQLCILINLKDVKMYQLVVTDTGFNFHTFIAGIQYSAEEKFYDEIQSSDARKYQTGQGINIVAKKHTPFKWPRFTKEKKKFLHIKYDLIHIDDSDTDEQSTNINVQNMRRNLAIDENSSSTDEDEKYVEPWKDFAQQKSPYGEFN